MNTYLVPLILLGSALGAFKRGEDGVGTAIVAAVMLYLLIQGFFEEDRQRNERERRESQR